jgi:hypothetical protein
MNDLRAKLAALFRHAASPDISDEEAVAALREFRALGCTPREINEALGATPPAPLSIGRPATVAASAHQCVQKRPQPKPQVFNDPLMPYGQYGPNCPGGAWRLTRINKVNAKYLHFLLEKSTAATVAACADRDGAGGRKGRADCDATRTGKL